MSLLGFQQALSELVLSAKLRSRVAGQEPEALAAFDLDERETRRLVAVARHPGLGTGVLIHRSFRLSMVTETLPRTCQLLGEDFGEIIHGYWRDHLPLNYQYLQEALRFARHLRRLHESGQLADAYLPEVLRLDLATLGLSRGLAPEEVALGAGDLAAPPSADRLVLAFEHEPAAVLEALEASRRPDAPRGAYRLAVHRLPEGAIHLEPVAAAAD